jgi:two-component system NarL family response regulator
MKVRSSSTSRRTKSCIRVLIVDDHFVARIGLSLPINQEPDMTVVGESKTLKEAVAMYRELLPDVVVMDYRLPDGDGPGAVEEIRKDFPDARFLILSAFDGEEPVFRAIQAGVRGYLTKGADCSEVLDSIRRIHEGMTVIPESLAAKAAKRLERPQLSARELSIIQRLALGSSNKQIADQLGISESLIKQELVRIFDKLGAQDRAHAATLAIQRGLVSLRTRE